MERFMIITSIAESVWSEVKNLSKVESFSVSTSALKSRISDISVSEYPSECLSESLLSSDPSEIFSNPLMVIWDIFILSIIL